MILLKQSIISCNWLSVQPFPVSVSIFLASSIVIFCQQKKARESHRKTSVILTSLDILVLGSSHQKWPCIQDRKAISDAILVAQQLNQIKLEWWGRYNGLESNEKDCLILQVDSSNVSSWGTLTCNNSITQNSWIAQSIIINSSQHTFDSSVTIRFKSYMDSTSDNFYFDGFNVTKLS